MRNLDIDAMSDAFSVATDESEVAPQENVMDLLINRAQFDKIRLAHALGNKELLPSAVQTFVTVDFFNHFTRHGELAEGLEPEYLTQFSFKNVVDDFYLQYLEKNTMTVEFFMTRAQNAIKIGTAKVVLSKLLERDNTFQAQEIIHESGGATDGYSIGKVFFKMRMRKSIEEAMRWYQQKRVLRISRDPASLALANSAGGGQLRSRSKVITIHVMSCRELKRPDQASAALRSREMQPFFFYQFYTFEYTSPVLVGNSPDFDMRKQYQVEYTDQLIEYMKTQVLKIELIDESVDITKAPAVSDYIGCVRVPLKDLL